MSWFTRHIDRWVQHAFSVNTTTLAVCRIFFALYVLAILVGFYAESIGWLSALPQALYAPPPGIMSLLPGFAPPALLWGAWGGLTLGGIALLLGWRTPLASLLVGATIMLLDGHLFALGKIDHGRILLMWCPIIMSASSWGDALSLDARRPGTRVTRRWPYQLMALCLGFGLLTAGIPKLTSGWLSWKSQTSYIKFYENYHTLGRHDLLADLMIQTGDWTLFWELQDLFTVVFEIGFFFALISLRATRHAIRVALIFHWGVLLTMNIAFPEQLLIYLMFLRDYKPLAQRARAFVARFAPTAPMQVVWALGAAAGFIALCELVLKPVTLASVPLYVWCLYGVTPLLAILPERPVTAHTPLP